MAHEAAGGQTFRNKKAALEWLQDQGFKVSIGTFYTACKRGLCVVNEDGTVAEAYALHYALTHLKRIGTPEGGQSPLQAKKVDLEIENLKLKNKRAQFELEKESGKYQLTKDVLRDRLGLINYYDQLITNTIRTRMSDWLGLAHGDQKRLADVIHVAIDNWLDDLDTLSDMQWITVPKFRLVRVEEVPEIVAAMRELNERLADEDASLCARCRACLEGTQEAR